MIILFSDFSIFQMKKRAFFDLLHIWKFYSLQELVCFTQFHKIWIRHEFIRSVPICSN